MVPAHGAKSGLVVSRADPPKDQQDDLRPQCLQRRYAPIAARASAKS
jgi:hypothetical protein